MGMDWHSSGITTSVIGALKRGLTPLQSELGIHVCGGRGKHSRQTPHELVAIGERVGFDGAALAQRQPAGRQGRQRRRAGRLRSLPARLHRHRRRPLGRRAAGHERRRRQARRYHWLSEGLTELRRRAARRDRRAGPGRDRQPRPTAAPRRRARRSSICCRRSGRTGSRASLRRWKRASAAHARAGASRCCRI